MDRSIKRQLLAAIAIILYWVVYYIQDHLANLGDYRFFPYSLHEVYGIGGLVLPYVTAIWFITLLIRSGRNKQWQKSALLLIILLALTIGQFGAIGYERQRISVTTVAEVAELTDEYHIVIDNGKERVTLQTSPLVPPLLKTDGTRYVFTYDTVKSHHDEGKLLRTSLID